MGLEVQREILRRYGVANWLRNAGYAALRRGIDYHALRGMTLELPDVDSKFLEFPDGLQCSKATATEFAQLPGADALPEDAFPPGAEQRGDWCVYLADGDTIASYGWYATVPITTHGGYSIAFSDDWVYMYNGFTTKEFRGRKLHAYGMAHALRDAVDQGFKGLISWVEAANFASLRSVDRLGYRIFGTCRSMRVFGRDRAWSSAGCRPYQFRLVRGS
jgi:GNAT superfamily N-acetyltransferase